jgi:hypothetical protein
MSKALERAHHGVDRKARPIGPPLMFSRLSARRLPMTARCAGVSTSSVVDEILGRDNNLPLGACHFDKITLLQAEFGADLFRYDDLSALAKLTDGHGCPRRDC